MNTWGNIASIVGDVLGYKAQSEANDIAKELGRAQVELSQAQIDAQVKVQQNQISNEAMLMERIAEEAKILDQQKLDLIAGGPSPIVTGSEYVKKSTGISPVIIAIVALGIYLAKRN